MFSKFNNLAHYLRSRIVGQEIFSIEELPGLPGNELKPNNYSTYSTKSSNQPISMIINQLFYTIKPAIPRRLQIALRRQIARYKRNKYSHVWPIDPSANKPPDGWTGWPDGKKFALVLSHDVDTKRGQDRVKMLAKIEVELGFRSAFNFVPERYVNHNSLRDDLNSGGFEINLHGLKHDGKLFMNRKIFEQRVLKINEYLKAWGATGFTAPSMHSRQDWLHILDITHSISTFDTDPFEPQPDAAATIFPLSIYRNSSGNAASQPPSLPAPQRPTIIKVISIGHPAFLAGPPSLMIIILNCLTPCPRIIFCSLYFKRRASISGNTSWTGSQNMVVWLY